MTLIAVILYLLYLSLAIELLFFKVPSVASSYNLWSEKDEYKTEMKNTGLNISEWSVFKKLIFLASPILIIYSTFIMPLLYASGILEISDTYYWIEDSEVQTILKIIPFMFMIIGRGLSFYAVMKIRKNNTQTGDSFELKSNSVYNRSRNPIQLGMYLFSIGLILLYPSAILIGGMVFYILYMDYKIKIEEKFLQEKFGDAFSEYSLKTKRYI